MRIIAGAHKGRQLKAVPGMETRPTGNKMKEAVFHRMGPFFDGGSCLDLFAGSGALGIEALSRGVDHVVFIDQASQAIKTIHANIKLVKEQLRCQVYRNDALKALDILSKKREQFSLILLDPPYDQPVYQPIIDTIMTEDLLESKGLLYVEHRPEAVFTVDEHTATVIFQKHYNDTTSATILKKVST